MTPHGALRTGAGAVGIGLAGWSYPDWRGVFYPPGLRPGVDELSWVARFFDVVEINSSFYRFPQARHAASWRRAVEGRAGFSFTAKVTRDLTHERELGAGALRDGARRLLEGLEPLREAGILEALLAQFPPWFRDGPEARQHIAAIAEALRPLPLAVEVRHASFLARARRAPAPDFLPFLAGLGASFVNVDMPAVPGAVPASTVDTAPLAYVRLHGRNAEAWRDPRAGRDAKYDYLYSIEELAPWVERLRALSARVPRTIVIANNHFRGQAPANALEIAHLLGRAAPAPPDGLAALYPRLAQTAARSEEAP